MENQENKESKESKMKDLLEKLIANVKRFGVAITATLGGLAVTIGMLSQNINAIKDFFKEHIASQEQQKQEQVVVEKVIVDTIFRTPTEKEQELKEAKTKIAELEKDIAIRDAKRAERQAEKIQNPAEYIEIMNIRQKIDNADSSVAETSFTLKNITKNSILFKIFLYICSCAFLLIALKQKKK